MSVAIQHIQDSSKWEPQEPVEPITKEKTLIIFDWDDTLLCSSWLVASGYGARGEGPITSVQAEAGAILATYTRNALVTAMGLGRVVIVTNGMQGWIERSCAIFMPSVSPILSLITVMSAQERYKEVFKSTMMWKRWTFSDVYQASFAGMEGPFNILSIGDGVDEEQAVHRLNGLTHKNLTKSVKLKSSPSAVDLVVQLKEIAVGLPSLVSCGAVCNLKVEV